MGWFDAPPSALGGQLIDAYQTNIPSILGGNAGGWQAAPGLKEAGYDVAPGITQLHSDPAAPDAQGVGGKGLADALGTLGKATGSGAGAAGGGGGGQASAPQLGRAAVGQPSHPLSLDNLVQMLAKRREMYLQAAMSPGGAAPAGVAPTRVGLLGF